MDYWPDINCRAKRITLGGRKVDSQQSNLHISLRANKWSAWRTCVHKLALNLIMILLGTRNTIRTIQYNTIQYNTIQYNTIQYNTIQYDIMQRNTIIQYNIHRCMPQKHWKAFWISVGEHLPFTGSTSVIYIQYHFTKLKNILGSKEIQN